MRLTRHVFKQTVPALVGAAILLVTATATAHAVCRDFEASHNGTDMFHPTGAVGAAVNKLMTKIDEWEKDNRLQNVRLAHKVRTGCGEEFMKYMLPHRRCVAKVRACGRR